MNSKEVLSCVMDERLFKQLPAHLVERVLGCLHPNEIACTIRLVSKSFAASFPAPEFSRVQLSHPVPPHAFAHHWGPTSPVWRRMTLAKRLQLLSLTAASGSLTNLQLAISGAGCLILSDVLEAAAAAGQLHICQWLRQQGCPWGNALASAATSDHLAVCEWMLDGGPGRGVEAALAAVQPAAVLAGAVAAALQGHMRLLAWLLPQALRRARHRGKAFGEVFAAAVAGAPDLDSLQQLLDQRMELLAHARGGGDGGGCARGAALLPRWMAQLWDGGQAAVALKAAAGSPRPDWQARVVWLEEQLHVPRTPHACRGAAGLRRVDACRDGAEVSGDVGEEAAERLRWLLQRGFTADRFALTAAAAAGNVAALVFLMDVAGVEVNYFMPTRAAAEGGHLAVLQAFRARDIHIDPWDSFRMAAVGGHKEILEWLWTEFLSLEVGGLEAGVSLGWRLLHGVARSGRVDVLEWVVQRTGCDLHDGALADGVASGSEEVIMWLEERGCQLEDVGPRALRKACRKGDLATIRFLRRRGCSWGRSGDGFTGLVHKGAPLAALRAVVAEGCPAEWPAALAGVREQRGRMDGKEVVAWMQQQQQQQPEQQEQQLKELHGHGAAPPKQEEVPGQDDAQGHVDGLDGLLPGLQQLSVEAPEDPVDGTH